MRDCGLGNIIKFFEDTTITHDAAKDIYEFSILYLLVRDIQTCLNITAIQTLNTLKHSIPELHLKIQ